MKFATVNLGCKVNHVELEGITRDLLLAGLEPSDEAAADLIVVNTCTVTGEAERKARKAVNRALAANAHATVVVTGCSVAINPTDFAALSARVRIVLRPDMPALMDELRAAVLAEDFAFCADESAGQGLFRTRSGIKIQDGCNNACTYCIVHVARGASRSVQRAEVLAQVAELLAQDTSEIVLTGINLGSYADEEGSLASLLQDCLSLAEDRVKAHAMRFRLSSIEPTDISDDLIRLMVEANGAICRHLHIPLQSGSTPVLHEMARHYTADEYLALIARLRAAMPEISLTTDVIVGFPGETDEQFAETCEVCRKAGFSKIHVFPYSMRAGTPAAARKDQVPAAVKQARAAHLRRLSDELSQADTAARVGTQEAVLVEDKGFGMTESYHRVRVAPNALPGTLVSYTHPVLD